MYTTPISVPETFHGRRLDGISQPYSTRPPPPPPPLPPQPTLSPWQPPPVIGGRSSLPSTWQSTIGGPYPHPLDPDADAYGDLYGTGSEYGYPYPYPYPYDDGRKFQYGSGVGEGSSRSGPFTTDELAEDYIISVTAKYKASSDDDGGHGETIISRTKRPPKFIPDDLIDPAPPKIGITKVERVVDPDGESSSLCSACRLPIFSTPSISLSHGTDRLFMHEQCARLPPQLRRHELHPHHTLLLQNQLIHPPPTNSTPTCRNCNEICGTLFYQCPNPKCDFRLDLLCVSQIKIMHRSHHHAMMAIRQRDSNFLTCSACDTKHDFSSSETDVTLSYLCNLCGFWIHPDCATLPNAIVHYQHHDHSLFLTYNLPISDDHSKCLFCSRVPKRSSGVYFCLKCPDYLVHFKCARSIPPTFKPVFIRDAKVSDLARLPLPNENTSLIPYLRQDHMSDGDVKSVYYNQELHHHPLILNKIDESPRVCNACVQSVSPPFYSCSKCPDFFLHSCCAHLPREIKHPIHRHPLSLSPKAPESDISAAFSCKGCHLRCNGFAYSCKVCDDHFSLDVVCAMINPAITHESHKNTHILFMSRDIQFRSDEKCNGCSSSLEGICYECSICRNFKLHARCVLLPNTVSHHYDQHPLQLTITAPKKSEEAADDDDGDDDGGGDDDDELCEVCEEHIKKERWYYSCSECNQSFDVDCIPTVDRLSKIKLGSSVGVDCHGCSVALVRQNDAVCGGRRCGICGDKFCDDGDVAYECSKCFYGIHQNCAEKCLVKSKTKFEICPLQFDDCQPFDKMPMRRDWPNKLS